MGAMDQGVFLRRASGLRRSASGLDVFIFDTGLISVGLAVALNAYYIPAFYPAASMAVSSLLATGIMLLAGIGFYLWAVVLPRSGGNYVFVSRALHPLLGFVVSWLEVAVLLFYTAVAAALIIRIGLATLLSGLGSSVGVGALSSLGQSVGGAVPTFILGALVIAACSGLLVAGMRRFFAAQKVMFLTALIGTVALFAALLYLGGAQSTDKFHSAFPDASVNSVVSTARSAGWTIRPESLEGSLAAIGWPLLALAGGVLSIGIGAEVQRARRTQLLGIIGSIVFAGGLFAVLGWMAEGAFGRDLLGAIGFSATNALAAGVPGGVPWMPFLVSALVHNWVVALLIGAGFIAWIYLWIPGMLAYCNRTFVAWSLDRVGPEWLGTVSDTRHTPTNGSLLGGLVAIAFLAAYVWIPQLQSLVVFQILMFAWALSLLGGALFPFLRKRLYDVASADGAVIRSRTVFSALMALGAVALLCAGVILWNDPIAAGHSPLAMGVFLGLGASGALVYVITATLRRRQGIELSRSFKEIPVE